MNTREGNEYTSVKDFAVVFKLNWTKKILYLCRFSKIKSHFSPMGVSTDSTLINHMKFYFYLVPFKQSPPKTEFHWKIYDGPLYPKLFFPFLSHCGSPQNWGVSDARGIEIKQDTVGPSKAQKPHLVPSSLSAEKV